jgi:hypothetical protein
VDPGAWLAPADLKWAPALALRARRATEALMDAPLAAPTDIGAALVAAARLFDAGLFFEVHELLEPHWMAAHDSPREALQGVIQITVGWQHLANGNVAGARSLLAEGARRLHGRRLGGVDFDAFARAALDAAASVPDAAPPTFPRLPL